MGGLHLLNRCIAWRSYFPTLLSKCMWFALAVFDVRVNLRSLMWGVGLKQYPVGWWKPALRRFFISVTLGRLVTVEELHAWLMEGTRFGISPRSEPLDPTNHVGQQTGGPTQSSLSGSLDLRVGGG